MLIVNQSQLEFKEIPQYDIINNLIVNYNTMDFIQAKSPIYILDVFPINI